MRMPLSTNSLLNAVREYLKLGDFLHSKASVAVHSTTVTSASSLLDFSFDIDGIVMEMQHLQGLLEGLPYLLNLGNMAPHYHLIMKHLDHTKYSGEDLVALRHVVSHTVGHIDAG